ncbi:1290_t:CDS:1, partial [Gigaspora margarita]
MDLKGNIEALKEIRSISYVAIQQDQAIQREQRTKKAKKVHNETAKLVSEYQEQNLASKQSGSINTLCTMMLVEEFISEEVQTTTNVGKNSRLSIEDPILEVKAKTDEREITTNEETCTEMEIEEPEK